MGAGGGTFVPRTAEEKAAVPIIVDAGVAVASGLVAAVAVSPFLLCVDRGVVAAAAGTAPGYGITRGRY
jgi:thiazole synthase ThiGH ThiG subunit